MNFSFIFSELLMNQGVLSSTTFENEMYSSEFCGIIVMSPFISIANFFYKHMGIIARQIMHIFSTIDDG